MTPSLETHDLTKRFGRVLAVGGVTLGVEPGEVVGFLGPNGAGKSTTLRLILGLLRPTRGGGTIMGCTFGSPEARARVAYVPGDVTFWPQLTGGQVLDLLARLHGGDDGAYREALVDRFELDPTKKMRDYSKGNRQKVALIAALATRAPVLLLDEPTSGLDPLMEKVFRECVLEAQAHGQATLLSSHVLSEVEQLCSRVALIRDGRLLRVADVAELRQRAGVEFDLTGEFGPLDEVEGVTRVHRDGSGVHVSVQGSPAPLLRALGTMSVTSLVTRESSLEEIFLSFYDSNPS